MKNADYIILIDGTCTLCSRGVNYIRNRRGGGRFQFLSLYTPEGKVYLSKYGLPAEYHSSVVLIDRKKQKAFIKSEAVLHIFRTLRGLWPVLYIFIIIPRSLRDLIYNWVAKHRHRFQF